MHNNALTLFLDMWDLKSGSDTFPLDDGYEDYIRKIEEFKKASGEYQYLWVQAGDKYSYPVEKFLQAPIFDGKTFWEVEQEIEWVDD